MDFGEKCLISITAQETVPRWAASSHNYQTLTLLLYGKNDHSFPFASSHPHKLRPAATDLPELWYRHVSRFVNDMQQNKLAMRVTLSGH
ncbi:MAG: hypothetical protein WBN88_00725 [Anderseniella sp.]